GDNSTISCCEVLNNLIFPAHEQHHNNSFLIASCVKGQSNMAAGATVGSNHNSRTNDNEVVAGRGFWPGLCTSIKHSSVFASYTLLSKGAYPAEMHVQLPFCMLSNNETQGELEIFPAFWWIRNMYALARNSWKYQTRDKRITKVQNIEFDTYAPDSMEEALTGRRLLEIWTAKAWLRARGLDIAEYSEEDLCRKGHELFSGDREAVDRLEVFGEGVEKSHRPVRIRKPYDAWNAYGDMLIHYAVKSALSYIEDHPGTKLSTLSAEFQGERQSSWVNLGGQLMAESDVDQLRADIRAGRLRTWKDIHARYDELWDRYPEDKLRHACQCLCALFGVRILSAADWKRAIREEERIQQYICDQVYLTRKKDYQNPFRQATYRSEAEMLAAIGELDDNSFVRQIRSETELNLKRLAALAKTLK
ncbi:MAG: DUF4954 family protein, partial [Bacteroidales bacterium]|nr:DUF4954 family protein [Bacteroidales bacterium]